MGSTTVRLVSSLRVVQRNIPLRKLFQSENPCLFFAYSSDSEKTSLNEIGVKTLGSCLEMTPSKPPDYNSLIG